MPVKITKKHSSWLVMKSKGAFCVRDVQSVSNTQKKKFRVLTRPSGVKPLTFVLVK